MAWWDTLFDLGSSVLDFAKSNPTTTGAALGLLTGGFKGEYGEKNLQNTALGGALGFAAGQASDFFRPGAGGAATAPNVTGAPAPTASTMPSATPAGGLFSGSNPSLFSSSPSNASITGDFGGIGTPSMATAPNFYDRVSNASNTNLSNALYTAKTADAVGGAAKQLPGIEALDKLQGGLDTVRGYADKYSGVADVGLKIGSAVAGQENARKQRQMMEEYERRRSAADAENKSIVDKQNALTQLRADEYMAMDPNRYGARAYASTVAGVKSKADQARAAAMAKGSSAATADAERRRALLSASTQGVEAADSAWNKVEGARRAGLSSINYKGYETPTYDAGYAETLGKTANAETQGLYKLGEDILGVNKKKAEDEVKPDTTGY